MTDLIKPVPLLKSLVVLDVATGSIELVSGFNGTVSFLQVLGRLYDSFGIEAHSTGKAQLSLQDAAKDVAFVNDAIKKTVSEVKQKHSMATNWPEGTISSKTQTSLRLLEQGMRQLNENVTAIQRLR